MAGYSGTPLPQKLGIKEGGRVGLSKPPPDFAATLGTLPAGAVLEEVEARRDKRMFNVLVAFVVAASDLPAVFAQLRQRLDPAGGLWIGWPKEKAKKDAKKKSDAQHIIDSDVTENAVRHAGLAAGLVDNKVCAIDDTWSGLRFVVRLVDRPTGARKRSR